MPNIRSITSRTGVKTGACVVKTRVKLYWETSKPKHCHSDERLLRDTIMDPTPAGPTCQKRSQSESAAPRRSIFRDLLTPTDSETRFEANLTRICLCIMFRVLGRASSAVIAKILRIAVKHALISLIVMRRITTVKFENFFLINLFFRIDQIFLSSCVINAL